MIDALLRDHGVTPDRVEGLAVSLGPGSFTGLRVGVSLAKGLAFGWKKPLIGIPTLEVVARQVRERGDAMVPLIDAKRGDVYWAVFNSGGEPRSEASCDPPQAVRAWIENHSGQSNVLTGAGLQLHRAALEGTAHAMMAPEDQWMPRAETVALMAEERLQAGKKDDPSSLAPLYLREFPVRQKSA
jgi:tRNA threonylcarbamoyladenosine biosynthesis protein TsaB